MPSIDRISRTGRLLMTVVLTGLVMCSSSNRLSSSELAKLDPPLQGLVQGDETLSHLLVVHGSDGEAARYSVVLRVSDPAAIRDSGLPIASDFGSVMTARLTLDEIIHAARQEGVVAVENPERRGPD